MFELLNTIDAFVWGPAMIALLLGSHLFFTFKTGFIQRKLPQAIKLSLSSDPEGKGDISHFGALATALAATIGTGSIVGVATAILAGGPGAVFWMWITGVFGIATKYAEVYAAVKYRVRDHNGAMLGGALYIWERAFRRNAEGKRDPSPGGHTPWWAKLGAVAFAAFAAIAAIGTGSAVQASAMSGIITSNVDVPAWVVGVVIVVLVSVVIFGGVQSISKVCEKLVPVMAVAYALGCFVILAFNWTLVGDALGLILECAFTSKAAFGGAVGSGIMMALQFGCARGLFSNESGLGSAPIVASAASTRNPAQQALVAPILVLGMVAFSYTTILGWSYYGNRCITYLFGRYAIRPYQVIYVAVAFLGAIGVGDIVWTISDIGNALMAIPNIIVVLLLSGMIARETRHYVYDGNLDEADDTPIPQLEGK